MQFHISRGIQWSSVVLRVQRHRCYEASVLLLTPSLRTPFWLAAMLSVVFAVPCLVRAEPVRQQAAAEAYDRGSAAYMVGEYEEAAGWFETAYRHAPAVESLLVAARSHERAGNSTRACTLAMELRNRYQDNAQAVAAAEELLAAHEGELVLVKVSCDECTLELDGRLQTEFQFFVEPNGSHTVTASNGDDQQTKKVNGIPGQELRLPFELASRPQVRAPIVKAQAQPAIAEDGEPFAPVVTYTAVGVTGALLAASLALTLNARAGVADYEAAAATYRDCVGDCTTEEHAARKLLSQGQTDERHANMAWGATAAVALVTVATALWWTDWSDGETSADRGLHLAFTPGLDLRSGQLTARGAF